MNMSAWKMRLYAGPPPKIGRQVGIALGIAISILISYVLFGGSQSKPQEVPSPVIDPYVVDQRDPRDVAAPHLRWAEAKNLSEIDGSLEQVRAIFAEARSQTRNFAEEALGWDSKFTIVSDYFHQKSDHAEFLREKFEKLVISEEALLLAIERAISQFQQVVLSTEGEMLVRLRADADDLKFSPIATATDRASLQSLFYQALSQSGDAAGVELQAALGREVAGYIMSEIATYVGIQLGVSTGILTAGAATGWMNLGINLAVGLAIDQMVTAAYDAAVDPKGQLAAQINEQLDLMEQLILEGANDEPGLRSRLLEFARERASVRESAVLNLLTAMPGGAL